MPKVSIQSGVVAKAALAHFASLLRVRRKEKRLTLDELADRLNASTPTVRKMLEGAPTVAIGTYFEAAHILNVPLFDPDSDHFAVTASRTAELESLLPKRIVNREEKVDDDF